MMYKSILAALCIFSAPLLGESLAGEYGISGYDPYTGKTYQGKAHLREKGNVYHVTWHTIPEGTVYVGTGIRQGNSISFVFSNRSKPEDIGVQLYTVQDDTLSGKWVLLGRDRKGSETLKLLESSQR